MSDFEWVTVKDYAADRKVHERTVLRWIRQGYLEAERMGRHGQWRIKVIRANQKAS